MKHNNALLSTILVMAFLLPLSVQATSDWQVLPVLKPSYKPDFAVAVLVGGMQADDDNKDKFSPAGLEVSLNCPLLKTPKHTIRQQISYTQAETNGFKTKSFELSPHHMFKVGEKVTAGFGPSIGYTTVENPDGDDSVVTYGLGASTRYDVTKKFFVGAEVRYVKAQEFEIADKTTDFDNARALVKLGYQF